MSTRYSNSYVFSRAMDAEPRPADPVDTRVTLIVQLFLLALAGLIIALAVI
ncbi:hypothetical protein [Catellatospora citrea]|uniref:Uncharacterized protein n=1 Tax=Catellatospora citrea TaxID=53366 RepID=A0A8J3KLS0_9ACTN|nr:hypothetical protein [Catellatospora citrea]RKE05264.1 hypothetical protein C8E86_0059 [Catellatospora citrea]GIF98194.1 hypothetical protein Cci01nite_32880 [Catellatospora citrea]